MLKYTQDFLPNFLDCEAEAREKMIDETTRQVHLAREFIRFDKALKLCRDERMKAMLQKCKQQTIKLMQRV